MIMILVSGVLFTSLITSYATAQKATDISFAASKTGNKSGLGESEKTAVSNAIVNNDETALKEMKANLKVAKANLKVTNHHEKNYKNVSGLKWNSEEKVIVATFKMNDKSARVVYNKRGNWLFTIITYNEAQMPQDIRSLVKANYGGYSISMVQEISQGDVTLYKVHLEDCNSLKQILVHNNEITVYEEFTKSR